MNVEAKNKLESQLPPLGPKSLTQDVKIFLSPHTQDGTVVKYEQHRTEFDPGSNNFYYHVCKILK